MMKRNLHSVFQEKLGNVPRILLKRMIERKLVEADVEPSSQIVEKIANAMLAGDTSRIQWDDDGKWRDVLLSFTHEDARELREATRNFVKHDLPEVITHASLTVARRIVGQLRKDWPEQQVWQQQSQWDFNARLFDRWGEGLNYLGMLLTVCRELGDENFRTARRSRATRNLHRRDVLIRLHARACQVVGEIIVLMESGYADGAMARWRTLHEICTVATLIAEHDNDLAQRYLAHEVVEFKRLLEEFLRNYKDLGLRPPAKRDVRHIEKLYQLALAQYGLEFGGRYGWAAKHLGLKRPHFPDLEKAAQRSSMRSQYTLACQNVHAGTKGITEPLGAIGSTPVILAGSSNAGLEEPGQHTAISLAQVTATLYGPNWRFDDIVVVRTLIELQNRAVKAFGRAGRQLAHEEAELNQASNQK